MTLPRSTNGCDRNAGRSFPDWLHHFIPAAMLLSGAILFSGEMSSLAARDQESEANEQSIDDIEVVATAEFEGVKPANRPGVEILEKKQWEGRFATLPEVLERAASLRVRRYGGTGSRSTVSIRGSTASQVNIYLNGVPLNDAYYGEVNLADLDLQSVERIEIYRSKTPAGLSGSSIGGAINIVTTGGGGADEVMNSGTAEIMAGSYRSFSASVGYIHSGGLEEMSWDVSGRGEVSDMDFDYLDRNGTPFFNTMDDRILPRKNAWYREGGMTGGASGKLSNTELSFHTDYLYRMHGLPGPSGLKATNAKRKHWRSLSVINTNSRGVIWDRLQIKNKLYYTEQRNHIFDPESEFSYGLPGSKSLLQKYGYEPGFIVMVPEYWQTIRLYAGIEREIFHRDQRDELDNRQEKIPTRFRNISYLHFEDEISLFSKHVSLTPSVRSSVYTDRFNHTSSGFRNESLLQSHVSSTPFTDYRLDATAMLYEHKKHSVYAGGSISTQKRIPGFLELFGKGGSIIGNTELEPEKSENAEVMMGGQTQIAGRKLKLDLAAFQKTVENMILFVPNSQFTLRPENIDAADIRGLEVSGSVDVFRNVRASGAYTYTKAKNASSVSYLKGKFLPLQPLHEFNGNLSWTPGQWEIDFFADYTGAYFMDRTNEYTGYRDPSWLYDLGIGYKFRLFPAYFRKGESQIQWKLMLDIKNITDHRREDTAGYPLPGRSYYVTISARF